MTGVMQSILFRLTAFCAALLFLGSAGTSVVHWYQVMQYQQQIKELPRYDELQQEQCARARAAGDLGFCVYASAPSLSWLEQDRDESALHAKVFGGLALLGPALLFALFYALRWVITGRTSVSLEPSAKRSAATSNE
jgi:hypothetical protein